MTMLLAFCAQLSGCREASRGLTVDQLKARVEAGGKPFVVDTRTEYEYRQGHLPGAINIPPHRFDSPLHAPARRQGASRSSSTAGGLAESRASAPRSRREKMGYPKVGMFTGGYPAWAAKGYHVEK